MTPRVEPLTGQIGAEIHGLDLTKPLAADVADALREAWREHFVLVVRAGEDLSAEQQRRFTEIFGEVTFRGNYRDEPMKEMFVSNTRSDGILPDGEIAFHNDQLQLVVPSSGCTLFGVEVPAAGGETIFSNNVAAYEALSEAAQRRLDGLTALHTFDTKADYNARMKLNQGSRFAAAHDQPLVWKNPETGRKTHWVSRITTVRINELPEAESEALIQELCDYIQDHAPKYVHKWRRGDLVLWDNWSVQHKRGDFAATERRTLRRMPILAGVRRFQ